MAAFTVALQVSVLALALSSGSAFVGKEVQGGPDGTYMDGVYFHLGFRSPRLLLQASNTPTGLIRAAVSGETSLVQSIIAAGVHVDAINSAGWTALTAACIADQPDTARTLIEAGADIDHKAAGGMTPLMAAGMQGHADVIELLLKFGAKKDVRASGRTAADVVCSCTAHAVGLIAKHCNLRECKDVEKVMAVFNMA
ncbi:hypothetical protein BSKO_09559 [Bryopsis sp. KO-2023]|nr:hypothetical protein BSKO_09559 [Bryopsis sp. KO-2023]